MPWTESWGYSAPETKSIQTTNFLFTDLFIIWFIADNSVNK